MFETLKIAFPTAALLLGALSVILAIIQNIETKVVVIRLRSQQTIILGVFGVMLILLGIWGYIVSIQPIIGIEPTLTETNMTLLQ